VNRGDCTPGGSRTVFKLCVHAIGDRANRETLDIYERAFKSAHAGNDLRWRIEHAQHLNPADIPRFAALGVIAAIAGNPLPLGCSLCNGPVGEKRAAEGRTSGKKLMKRGPRFCNGTDAPVET